jgi:hypothetical protein
VPSTPLATVYYAPLAAGQPPCTSDLLDGVVINESASAGGFVRAQIGLNAFRTGSCNVDGGFPEVQLLDANKRPIPTLMTRGDGPSQPPFSLGIGTGISPATSWASFSLGWAPFDDLLTHQASTCPTSSYIAVTPAGMDAPVVFPAQITPGKGGNVACTVTVGSLYLGLGSPPPGNF